MPNEKEDMEGLSAGITNLQESIVPNEQPFPNVFDSAAYLHNQ